MNLRFYDTPSLRTIFATPGCVDGSEPVPIASSEGDRVPCGS